MTLGAAMPACANEFDLLAMPKPADTALIDDTETLWKSTKRSVQEASKMLETKDGLTLRIAVTRRMDVENDVDVLAQKLLDQWYAGEEDSKGVLVLVTSNQEGALVGGPTFMSKFSDELTDSLLGETIPYWLKQEKSNKAVTASLERLQAAIEGREDPGPPVQKVQKQTKMAPRTQEQVDKYRRVSWTVIGTLIVIAFVVPMIQFWGYVSK